MCNNRLTLVILLSLSAACGNVGHTTTLEAPLTHGASAGTGAATGTGPASGSGGSTGGAATGGGGGSGGTLPTTPATHLPGNPFDGARMYVNPDYATNANTSLASVAAGSPDAQLIRKAQAFPTAVWLDSLKALAGGPQNSNRLSLAQHLDAAVAQGTAASQTPIVLLVVYNLPNRDCAAGASNGELQGATGLATYKAQYIDAIYAALTAKPNFQNVRIAVILEPDSLPNMVTNTSLPACATVASQNLYVDGITYAVQKLGSLPNVYIYLDIAHSGWLGWPNNMSKAVTLYTQVIGNIKNGDLSVVRGFATDISNYTPLREPFISPSNMTLLNGPFYQSNPVFDELTFVDNLAAQFTAAGFKSPGFLVDTSRSGWAKVNDGAPIDRRKARGDWCNVSGTGLGERPQASPAIDSHVDAFVYVKPPGESDGTSTPGNRFDPSCDPTNPAVEAMPNAPQAGEWFHAQFMSLLRQANPPL